jgi:hypothetical protein
MEGSAVITRLAAPAAATIAVALTAVGLASAASLRVSEEPVLESIAVVFPDCGAAAPTDPEAIVVPGLGCADDETPPTALGLSDGPGDPAAPSDVPAPVPTGPVQAPDQELAEPGPTTTTPEPTTPTPTAPTPNEPAPEPTEPAPTAPAPTAPAPTAPAPAPPVEEDAGV